MNGELDPALWAEAMRQAQKESPRSALVRRWTIGPGRPGHLIVGDPRGSQTDMVCPLCGVTDPQGPGDHTYPCNPQEGEGK